MYLGPCHCVKSVRIRSYSGPHFSRVFPHSDWIRRDNLYLSVFSPNAGNSGENTDQNNSEYGHFSSSLSNIYHGTILRGKLNGELMSNYRIIVSKIVFDWYPDFFQYHYFSRVSQDWWKHSYNFNVICCCKE